MRHHLALVALLAFTGTAAYAGPGRRAGRYEKKRTKAKKVAPPIVVDEVEDEDIDEDDGDDEVDEVDEAPRKKKRRRDTYRRDLGRTSADDTDNTDDDSDDSDDDSDSDDDDDDTDIAAAEDAADLEVDVALKRGEVAKHEDWHIAVGPYLWASSVDADVSLGDASVSTGVDFFDIKRHAKYGIELVAEARYGRFAIYTDLMYGVVGVDGGTEVGPLMVTLDGTASSLLADGLAGYRLIGGERSLVTLEVRAGVRYQRTSVSGSVNVAGTDVSPSTFIDSAADALGGAQAVLRPHRRFYAAGSIDHGVFGQSTRTWSATADAGVHITRRIRLALGWRTLTTTRTNVSIVMHGPRAALQFMF